MTALTDVEIDAIVTNTDLDPVSRSILAALYADAELLAQIRECASDTSEDAHDLDEHITEWVVGWYPSIHSESTLPPHIDALWKAWMEQTDWSAIADHFMDEADTQSSILIG